MKSRPSTHLSGMSQSTALRCRVCDRDFYADPLLRFDNMPAVAQHMPDAASIAGDRGVDLEVCQCSGCGLVQLSNAPVPYYREVIRAAAFSGEMRSFRETQFGSFCEKYALSGKNVIEIGCGRGEFLSLLQQAGMNSYGLEYGEASVSHCAGAGLKVMRVFLEDAACRLEHAPFDGFFLLNFLEHLPNPNGTLSGIGNNLSDEAVGLVEVPNFDMILRNNLFTEFIGDHLLYFTRETLAMTLQTNGFDIVDCSEIWHDYIISATVRKRKRLDLGSFRDSREQLRQEITDYIVRYGANKVAVWGAGHQALATMALTDLAGKIKYVVDSATFKQGKFTPATQIPIVAPDLLESDPVAAVIVMAASYSDEVVGILKQRHGGQLDIAVLRDYGLEIVR